MHELEVRAVRVMHRVARSSWDVRHFSCLVFMQCTMESTQQYVRVIRVFSEFRRLIHLSRLRYVIDFTVGQVSVRGSAHPYAAY